MDTFGEKRWVRTLCLILALVCTIFSFLCGYLYIYGTQDGWYNGVEIGFEDSRLCRTYIEDCLAYVYSNVLWKSDPTLDTLSAYGGNAFSYTIQTTDGEITADTTTERSVHVMDYDLFIYETAEAEPEEEITEELPEPAEDEEEGDYELYDYDDIVHGAIEEENDLGIYNNDDITDTGTEVEFDYSAYDDWPYDDTVAVAEIEEEDDSAASIYEQDDSETASFGELDNVFDAYSVIYPENISDSAYLTTYTLSGYVNFPISQYNGCYTEYMVFTSIYAGRDYYLAGVVGGTLVTMLLLGFAIAGTITAGKHKRKLSKICMLPFDVTAVALYFGVLLLYNTLTRPLSLRLLSLSLGFSLSLIRTLFMLMLAEGLVYMLVSQIAAGVLVRRSALCNLVIRLPLKIIMWVCFFILITGQCLFFFNKTLNTLWPKLVRWFYAVMMSSDALILLIFIQWFKSSKIVQKASAALASGDLTYKLDIKKLHFIWKPLGRDLNSIGDGMALAVEDRMRSERMKTELITNVSHDLKTPVTSIINYLDLMKDEDLTDEKRREYEAILERQAAKLKKLTEDVVEASKAVSGTMKVNWEELDITELLDQSVGEHSERLQEVGIEPVISKPRDSVLIQADGRLLGRVLDNLITNILKYAQQGTRAYFDLVLHEDEPELTVKNISRDPLNIPVEELLERFVQGDRSRSSEGSGLGLSIAASLMKLMGGNLHLVLDGDLFKAIITFQGPAKIVREEELLPEPQALLEAETEEQPLPPLPES